MEMDLSHAMPAWIVRPLRWRCGEARERSEPSQRVGNFIGSDTQIRLKTIKYMGQTMTF